MKAYRVVIAVEAAQDLDSLYAYIADRSGEAVAQRFTARLRDYCLGVAIAPRRGAKRDDLLAG
ncbi:MAG: type II toxin-antitoxin system RelE/ParE family toxin, partial [Bosea sp. (in: a-proteobacteria)]